MSYNYYEYESKVKIISGKDSAMQSLPDELIAAKCKAVMLISGQVLNRIGVVDRIKGYCDNRGVTIKAIFIDVPSDSSISVVEQIVKLFRINSCDSIIAVGGGSVIDTAKSVKLVVEQNGNSLREFMGLNMVKRGREIPFIILPTTAGTGSELTRVTVISDTTCNRKLEFVTTDVLPTACILAPELVLTLPQSATLLTGFDALSHAVEAYTSTQKNPLSDSMAVMAIRKIVSNLKESILDGTNVALRQQMLEAAALAGLSFSNSMVGAAHAIGHALGAICNVAHAQAIAILLPAVMDYNYSHLSREYSELLYYLVSEEEYKSTLPEDRGRRTIVFIREFYQELATLAGCPTCLRELNIGQADYEKIANDALRDGARLANIKDFEKSDIIAILGAVY